MKSLNQIKHRTNPNETVSEKYLRKTLIHLQKKQLIILVYQ